MMFASRSNQLLSGAVALVILIVAGLGLFALFNSFGQPEVTPQEQVATPIIDPTQPPPATEEPQPVAMFRGNLQRNGVYNDTQSQPTGELLWKFETGDDILSSPAVVDDVVYFGSYDYHLYAVNSQSGQEIWRFDTGGAVQSSPAVVDGVVYVGSGCTGDNECINGDTQTNQLLALEAQTGQEIWRFTTDMGVWSSPAVTDEVVYFGSHDQHLYAVNSQTGQEVWRFQVEDGISSSPAIADDTIYFGSGCKGCELFGDEPIDHFLYAVNRHTGQEVWRFKTEKYVEATPAVVDGIVYFGSADRQLYAVDGQTGQLKWQFKTFGPIVSSPAVADDLVYVTSEDRNLYAIDNQTGEEKWRFKTDWRLESSPLVAAGTIYFGSGSDGILYAVDRQTGQELWNFKTDEPMYASPTIANGVIYFGSEDDHLYAVK